MEKNCLTCFYANEGKCLKGQAAEIYCMGGDYELWKGKEIVTDNESENILAFPIEKVKSYDSIEEFEAFLGRKLSSDEVESFNKIKGMEKKNLLENVDVSKFLNDKGVDVSNRPLSSEEGFNGVKKEVGKIYSKSCDGCKNFSIVGCFLGKYYDCVDNGRYLYSPVNDGISSVESIEEKIERKEDEKIVDFIDGLLDNWRKING